MAHARGCVSDTLPCGSNPASPPPRRQLAVVGRRSRANSVGAVRYADSERWRRLATPTLTRSALQWWEPRPGWEPRGACRACAPRGGSRGYLHVAALCRWLYLPGALSGTITNGGCSPPWSAGPWSERRAGSVGPAPGGPAGRRGAVEIGRVRVRKVARGRAWLWGRDRACPSRSRPPSGGPA